MENSPPDRDVVSVDIPPTPPALTPLLARALMKVIASVGHPAVIGPMILRQTASRLL